jgi:hypothetical protein
MKPISRRSQFFGKRKESSEKFDFWPSRNAARIFGITDDVKVAPCNVANQRWSTEMQIFEKPKKKLKKRDFSAIQQRNTKKKGSVR